MIDINKIKAAAMAVKENGGVDNAMLFTDLTMPDAVLELIAQLEATQADLESFFNLYMDYKTKLESAERGAAKALEKHSNDFY